jgi:hypothetical protein
MRIYRSASRDHLLVGELCVKTAIPWVEGEYMEEQEALLKTGAHVCRFCSFSFVHLL